MRTAFISTLLELAREDPNLWLVTGDLGFSVLEPFFEQFPNQYVNAGVAEQDMIGISAGLALCGKKVFVYSIIPFITLRCLEQIRNDVCLQNCNVKLVGVGEGYSYGQLGPTHHSIEDIAVMRALPDMKVVCPGDPWEVKNAIEAAYRTDGPVYLRIGKKGEPIIHKKGAKFKIGKGIIVDEGKQLAIISTGNMLEESFRAVQVLADKGISARLISMHTIKPIDINLIIECAKKFQYLFTVEEHSRIGGLGSAVSEIVAEYDLDVKFHSFAVDDKFTKIAGTHEFLRKINGLSSQQIANQIIKRMQSI